jgi:hypothetical protein
MLRRLAAVRRGSVRIRRARGQAPGHPMTDPHRDARAAEPVSADAAAPPADRPAPLFVDAEGAARWVKTLPVADVHAVYGDVLEQLRALVTVELPPRERARVAEVLRQQVAYLHTELARRYAGKPQPAGVRDRESTEQAIALWQALWEQYSACLKPLLEGDPDLETVKAKLLQRGLYVGKELVLVYGLARRIPPAALWQELHAYYRLVEILECAASAVSDPLLPNGVGISCYSTYSHALLLGLADPCAMSIKQIQLADRWLEMWARKVHPAAVKRDTDGPVIVVDLDGATGASLVAAATADPAASLRFAYADKLATSVRGRLKRLQSGANPAELQLGHDCSVGQCTTLLSYLDWRWYQPPRQVEAAAPTSLSLCSGGLDAAYYRVGGRTFDRRGPLRPFGPPNAQHLASLDALTDYDRGRDKAERTWVWERWEGACEWREATLTRTDAAHYRWHLEQLAIVDDGERVRAGYVTRVAQDDDDRLALTLRLWSGAPKTLSLRPASSALAEEPPMPALLLAETPDDKACLILPPRTFNPGRMLSTVEGGPERRYRLTRLLQRGSDFERIAFVQQQ